MTRKEMKEFLKSRGWHTYYHPEYWVNKDVIEDPSRQDYTNYGMALEDAYKYEKGNYPKFKPMLLPSLSMMLFPYEEEEI